MRVRYVDLLLKIVNIVPIVLPIVKLIFHFKINRILLTYVICIRMCTLDLTRTPFFMSLVTEISPWLDIDKLDLLIILFFHVKHNFIQNLRNVQFSRFTLLYFFIISFIISYMCYEPHNNLISNKLDSLQKINVFLFNSKYIALNCFKCTAKEIRFFFLLRNSDSWLINFNWSS